MGSAARDHLLRQLEFVVASWREDSRTDVELLGRFVKTRDQQAFSTIVGRYSQLVWGVCRRVLANPADAEDALQATFLRLARDAGRIANRQALASWLFRAARGCAIDLRRMIARQRRIEERLAAVAERGVTTAETNLRMLLDDELAQLSERDREVLIQCCLEGRTYADVALGLGCSIAAVHRRLVRAQTLSERKNQYVKAERSLGASRARVLRRHVLPNVLPPLLVIVAMDIPSAVIIEAGLAFLGLGVQPPTADWGVILNDGFVDIGTSAWVIVGPIVALVIMTTAFTVLGETMRDVLDPRQRPPRRGLPGRRQRTDA